MCKGTLRWIILFLSIQALVSYFGPFSAFSGNIPAVGSYLPKLQLHAPASEVEKAYLGIGTDESFSINQLNCNLIMIEIIGVYCPKCHIQHPLFNKLFYRIKKDSQLYNQVKMIGIAVGANPIEVAFLKKEYKIPYPVITDPEFEVHRLLGEPRTPFTMIVTKDRKVLFAYLGIIRDIHKFYMQIRGLMPTEKDK